MRNLNRIGFHVGSSGFEQALSFLDFEFDMLKDKQILKIFAAANLKRVDKIERKQVVIELLLPFKSKSYSSVDEFSTFLDKFLDRKLRQFNYKREDLVSFKIDFDYEEDTEIIVANVNSLESKESFDSRLRAYNLRNLLLDNQDQIYKNIDDLLEERENKRRKKESIKAKMKHLGEELKKLD